MTRGNDYMQIQTGTTTDDVEPETGDFDLVALNHPLSTYTVTQKIQVVTIFMTTGNVKQASVSSGVPAATIHRWKKKSQWWDEACAEVRHTKNEELEAILTHSLHLASEQIVDRLEHGNEALVNGEVVRVKVPARELAQVTNCLFEKRALLRGDPSKITQEKKVDFSDLVQQFKDFSKELQQSPERVVN